MLKKLSIALLVLAGFSAAKAQEAHPLTQLQGTSRVLMVFAPDSNTANFKRQLQLIEHHSFELALRNTVVVPVSMNFDVADYYGGELLPLSAPGELSYARSRYHVQPSEFAVVLLNEDGAEQLRSTQPVDIHELTAQLDALPRR